MVVIWKSWPDLCQIDSVFSFDEGQKVQIMSCAKMIESINDFAVELSVTCDSTGVITLASLIP